MKQTIKLDNGVVIIISDTRVTIEVDAGKVFAERTDETDVIEFRSYANWNDPIRKTVPRVNSRLASIRKAYMECGGDYETIRSLCFGDICDVFDRNFCAGYDDFCRRND